MQFFANLVYATPVSVLVQEDRGDTVALVLFLVFMTLIMFIGLRAIFSPPDSSPKVTGRDIFYESSSFDVGETRSGIDTFYTDGTGERRIFLHSDSDLKKGEPVKVRGLRWDPGVRPGKISYENLKWDSEPPK